LKTKMNYLLKSSNFQERKRAEQKRILVIIIVLVLGMLVLFIPLVRQTIFSLVAPVWKLENHLLNSNLSQYFKSKQTLINEKIGIEQRLFLAGNLLAINDTLQKENDMLKDLLGRNDTKPKTILATILVKPPLIPYDTLTVDVGTNQNIKIGDKVIANANIYIGEVSEVFLNTAKIVLYSTPGRKLAVVLGTNSVTVEAVGIGGGNFNIYVPKEVEVKEGDVITVPSITANVFGIVEKVNFKETDSFQTVLFKSPVNISELSFVEVIL
jgi:cell shape-determining protein MreC